MAILNIWNRYVDIYYFIYLDKIHCSFYPLASTLHPGEEAFLPDSKLQAELTPSRIQGKSKWSRLSPSE